MKKTLVALAVLGSFAGAASAANSVTLYGRVDVGYEKWSGSSLQQVGGGETRLGIKGQEDLGNGLAATFQLEGRFDADVGAKTSGRDFFDRESTVGLKGNFGHVRFGRSVSAMENGIGRFAVGERVSTVWDPYASATRHSNAMFYSYENGGFDAGLDVTTKGGALGNTNEGASGSKVGYGAYAGYSIGGFKVAAAYQADKATAAYATSKEWGLGMSYTFNPVTVAVSYADARDSVAPVSKLNTWTASVSADITANDNVYVKYMNRKEKTSGFTDYKANMWGLGYSHAFSKRTSVYADIARYKVSSNSSDANGDRFGFAGTGSTTGYSLALRHKF